MIIETNCEKYYENILGLWRRNSSTLGFFPEGAFKDYLENNWIIVATDKKKEFLGYLAYRTSGPEVSVVHLCVEEAHRGKGIPKELMDALVAKTLHYNAIKLKCRRDYNASKLWPRLGFRAAGEVTGRSAKGTPLTVWRRDNDHPNLFTHESKRAIDEDFCFVIDANVFFDFTSEGDEQSVESKALLSDWMPEQVKIFVTDEMDNEIDRSPDPNVRKVNRAYIENFQKVPSDRKRYEEVLASLKSEYGCESVNQESDLKHLAHCISGGIKYFVTRDEDLLALGPELDDKYGVSLFRPSDLIIYLDEIENKSEYQPVRLSGTNFSITPLKAGEQARIEAIFISGAAGERKVEFERFIRGVIADPENSECFVCRNAEGEIQALFAFRHNREGSLEIPLLRIRVSPLCPTISRHLVYKSLLEAASKSLILVKFTDKFMSTSSVKAILEASFTKIDGEYYRPTLTGIASRSVISKNLIGIFRKFPRLEFLETLALDISRPSPKEDASVTLDYERLIWPGKISDAEVDCFIVPIRPFYAQQLFDAESASGDLLGAGNLILNRELAYYRSKSPGILTAPGRILWYVSSGQGYPYSRQLRASSYLDEVFVDKPKILFGLFRRLGIYQWKDVFKIAGEDVDKKIMAVKFSDTVLFKNPISWEDLQKVLREEGAPNNIQSPIRITPAAFSRLYALGGI